MSDVAEAAFIAARRSYPVRLPPLAWEPDCEVVRVGGKYTFVQNWKLAALAAILGTTYYVDIATGSGSNDGLSWAAPLKTIASALAKADVGVVYVKAGVYPKDNGWEGNGVSRSIALVAVGGEVIVSPHDSGLTWSVNGTHANVYQTTRSATASVMDVDILDANGDPTALTLKASVAEVADAPGSYYFDSGSNTVYVQTADNRNPSVGIRVYIGQTNGYFPMAGGTLYCEGIAFYGGNQAFWLRDNSGAGNQKAYFVDCKFNYATNATNGNGLRVEGCAEVYLLRCEAAANLLDGFNYHALSTVNVNALEANCVGRHNGLSGGGANQNSTVHEACNIIRVGGEYHHAADQNIADIGTGESVNIGAYAHDSRRSDDALQDCDFYASGVTMLLMHCRAGGSKNSLAATSSGTLTAVDCDLPGDTITNTDGVVKAL